MGTFTLEIELGDDAMRKPSHIAEALRELANKFDEMESSTSRESGKILDDNGNSCGEWEFENEPEEDEVG
jgi:hypothetical protein